MVDALNGKESDSISDDAHGPLLSDSESSPQRRAPGQGMRFRAGDIDVRRFMWGTHKNSSHRKSESFSGQELPRPRDSHIIRTNPALTQKVLVSGIQMTPCSVVSRRI